jgi:hypothetical protein
LLTQGGGELFQGVVNTSEAISKSKGKTIQAIKRKNIHGQKRALLNF